MVGDVLEETEDNTTLGLRDRVDEAIKRGEDPRLILAQETDFELLYGKDAL